MVVIPWWVLALGGAAAVGTVAAVASGGGGGPQRVKGKTFGPDASKVPVKKLDELGVTGEKIVTYSQVNNQGNVGGLVPYDQKNAPSISIPNAEGIVGKIAKSFVAVYDLVKEYTGGKLYPDKWTEPDGQLFELVRVSLPDGRADIVVTANVQAGWEDEWFYCRRVVWDETIEVGRILDEADASVFEYGTQSQKARIACLYSNRAYDAAGLSVDVIPRPAPGDVGLVAVVAEEAGGLALGLYLWLPPRLGKHRAKVEWKISRA